MSTTEFLIVLLGLLAGYWVVSAVLEPWKKKNDKRGPDPD